MKYTMKLTDRHQFPDGTDGTIFADGAINKRYTETGETKEHYEQRLDAWAEFSIPDDCTQLDVYMSGYCRLRWALIRVCKDRGIELGLLWPKNGYKRLAEKGDESWSKSTEAYKRALVHYHT